MTIEHVSAFLLSTVLPGVGWANAWSSCQVITAITDYTAYASSVHVVLSPGVSGCSGDAPDSIIFQAGQMGVTSESLKSLMATPMAAYLSEKPVMIYYDNSSSACYASTASVGGHSAQCN